MFSWGEDGRRGFRLQKGATVDSGPPTHDRVHHLELGYRVADVSAGRRVLAFVKTNGNAFVIRTSESKGGRRVRGKQIWLLPQNGAVFTFGSGQYGQLGHNSFADELRPRLVVELWGAKVTKIACGRHHTLALTDSNRVYSFACGEQGQLGHGEESHPSVPLPVQLPQDTAAAGIRNIFAGGNCSLATCASTKNVRKANTGGVNDRVLHRLDDTIDKWTTECDLKSWEKIKK